MTTTRGLRLALTLLVAATFGVPLGAAETSPRAAETSGGAAMSRGWAFDEQGGAALFQHVCAACHQADAGGAVGAGAYPALAADANLASKAYVLQLVIDGRGAMPPVGRMMSDAQIADVVNYVRNHFGNAFPDPLSAAEVAAAKAQP